MDNHIYGFYNVYTIPLLVYHIIRHNLIDSVQLLKYNKVRNTKLLLLLLLFDEVLSSHPGT